MQLNYHDQAADKGVYIVGSCGFDSIPADMGVVYTRDQFKGMFVMQFYSKTYYITISLIILIYIKQFPLPGALTAVESFLTASAGPEVGVLKF